MDIRRLIVGVLAATLAAGALAAAAAQESAPDPAASPEAQGVVQAVTAAELAAWGRRNRDPGALIMAARLMAEVPMRPGGEAPALVSPSSLLDEAAVLSAGDPGVLDMIQLLREHGVRGVHASPFGAGPIFIVRDVAARDTYGFDVQARGGEILRVAAIGDGDTDIDIALTGPDGALMCHDGYGDHYPVCTVVPREASVVRVAVVNRGDVWTKVQILSN